MSFPRLSLLLVPTALVLPLLTGGCGVPVAVAAAGYGADGVSVVESGKTTADHFTSMVSKKDCALWRIFRNRSICEERDPTKPDPYNVNYDEPFRQQSEGGVEYSAPLHAAPNAPAASWDIAAYKPAPAEPAPAPPPVMAVAEAAPQPVVVPLVPVHAAAAVPATHKHKAKKPVKVITGPKKPSQDQVASSR
jgi:hypothetical protein